MKDSFIADSPKEISSQTLHSFAETTPLKIGEKEQITYGAFLVSFLILVLASGLKYFINGNVNKKKLCRLILELSIDTLTITIAVLTSYYYRVSSMSKLMVLVLLAIIFIAIGSALRRGVIEDKITNPWLVMISYIICWAICILGVFVVYIIVI